MTSDDDEQIPLDKPQKEQSMPFFMLTLSLTSNLEFFRPAYTLYLQHNVLLSAVWGFCRLLDYRPQPHGYFKCPKSAIMRNLCKIYQNPQRFVAVSNDNSQLVRIYRKM